MESHWLWWIFALGMLIAELFTGTFYLLVVAIALAAGGLVAYFDAGLAMQLVVAAAVGFGGALMLRRSKFGVRAKTNSANDPNVNIDIGNTVTVGAWDAARRARVVYRGASWDVEFDGPAEPSPGTYKIKSVRGSTLIVS
ncbi:MAG: NfeD family protein [Burkholderiaceae bacterium]